MVDEYQIYIKEFRQQVGLLQKIKLSSLLNCKFS